MSVENQPDKNLGLPPQPSVWPTYEQFVAARPDSEETRKVLEEIRANLPTVAPGGRGQDIIIQASEV